MSEEHAEARERGVRETVIDIAGLHKSFRTGDEELHILSGVELSVEAGRTVVVTGESGSGKSTLLNIIGGLEEPSSGSVRAAGYAVPELSEDGLTRYRSRMIGLVFQFHYLLKDFTAQENLMVPALIAGGTRREAEAHAGELLDAVGLRDRADHFPMELSGGERQRVAVARALVNAPEIVLADEPTGNLDEHNSGIVKQLLFDLARRYGKTLLLVTHDLSLAEGADQRYRLEHGRLTRVQ
jgi:lipoprotein-releasing system ATP-binding protein